MAYLLLVQFIFNAWVCKHVEVLQTLITVPQQFFTAFWVGSWFINWTTGTSIFIFSVSYSSFYVLHWFRSLTLHEFLIRALWSLFSFFVRFLLRSFFFKVLVGFGSLKILVLDRCFKIFLLLCFLGSLLFFIFLVVIASFGEQFSFWIFLLDLHKIINLFTDEPLVFIFDVKIDLYVDIVSVRCPGPDSLIKAPPAVFIHCSYNIISITNKSINK